MDNRKFSQITARAKQRIALLIGNYTDFSSCAEKSILSAFEETDSETREISLDTAIETIGYMNTCVCDIREEILGVFNCLDSAISQKTCRSGSQQNSTINCTATQSREIQQQILSFANLLNNLK